MFTEVGGVLDKVKQKESWLKQNEVSGNTVSSLCARSSDIRIQADARPCLISSGYLSSCQTTVPTHVFRFTACLSGLEDSALMLYFLLFNISDKLKEHLSLQQCNHTYLA